MKCFKCRNNLPDDSKFCQFCGADLTQIDDHMSADEQPAETEVEASAAAVATEEAVNATRGRKFRSLWWLFLPIALCVFAAIVSVLSARSESSTTPAQAAENVLYLEIYDSSKNCIGSGSGFLINDGVTLVTNYHVIEDAYQIFAKTSHGETSVEVDTVWAYDETADIAILKCSSAPGVSPLRLADSNQVKQGDSIYAAGYPLGVANTLSDGIISSRYVDENGVDLLQITAPISGGSSGGALLNEFGEVIGVVCAYYIDGQNMNIAIAANVIDKVLRENGYIQPIFSLYLKNHPLPKPEDVHPAKPLPVPDDSKPITCSHSYGAWTIETEATCTRKGSKVRTCSLCGKVQTATVDMIEHTKIVDPAIAATCTTEGKTAGTNCGACGIVLIAQSSVPMLEHEYLNDRCKHCGERSTSARWAGTWVFSDDTPEKAQGNWFRFDFNQMVVIWNYDYGTFDEIGTFRGQYRYPFRVVDETTLEMSQSNDLNEITDWFKLKSNGTIERTSIVGASVTHILIPQK